MRTRLIAAFAAGALTAGLVVVGGIAVAQPDEVEITACVTNYNGQMRLVDNGDDCRNSEYSITWNQVGEPGPPGPEGPPGPPGPGGETLELFVDCDASDSVNAALSDAQDHPGPVSIVISGVCEENVGIDRSDVSLAGLQRSDGIRSPSAGGSTVFVGDAHGVRLFNMTITGGSAGIEGSPGSSFSIDGVTVQDAITWGVIAAPGSTAELQNCVVQGTSDAGITASGGVVSILDCLTTGNTDGLKAEAGGRIVGFTVDVSGNSYFGAVAGGASVITLYDSTISNNAVTGVDVGTNAAVSLDNSVIANNGGSGVEAGIGGSISIGTSLVEGNGGNGIGASHAATVFFRGTTTIRANAFDGVVLNDQSAGVGADPGTVIADNGGYGINCAGPPGFPVVQNGFDLPSISFSGNTNGATNCP